MTNTLEIGAKGEEYAANYLVKKGYTLIERNWRYKQYELDIIATHNKLLIFVEVRSRAKGSLLSPADTVNRKKQQSLIQAANAYFLVSKCEFEARFDIITVVLSGERYEIEHIENAFYPILK
jgi:putative endonuclease